MIREYMAQYVPDETKFFHWLKTNYIEPQDALVTIFGFMEAKKKFKNSQEFCESVVRETWHRRIDQLIESVEGIWNGS